MLLPFRLFDSGLNRIATRGMTHKLSEITKYCGWIREFKGIRQINDDSVTNSSACRVECTLDSDREFSSIPDGKDTLCVRHGEFEIPEEYVAEM